MKKITLIISLLSTMLLGNPLIADETKSATKQNDVLQLNWLDLIPESERNQQNNLDVSSLNHKGETPPQSKVGGIRHELNGSMVQIPGFVIPLEGDKDNVTEFMLVPFLGACIHVPPPPPNQLVYVYFKEGAPVQELWDVVYVTGQLKTEPVTHELAETGYSLDGVSIEPYDDY